MIQMPMFTPFESVNEEEIHIGFGMPRPLQTATSDCQTLNYFSSFKIDSSSALFLNKE